MNLDLIKQDVKLISQPGAVPMASLNLTADLPEAEVDLEEVSKLVDELKQLELEEEALIRKKRLQELREMVELKIEESGSRSEDDKRFISEQWWFEISHPHK